MYFYSIAKGVPKSDEIAIASTVVLTQHSKMGESSKQYSSTAANRKFSRMSNRVFKRTLAFFNYKWVDKEGNDVPDDTVVTQRELRAFTKLFSKFEFGTVVGF